MAERIFIGVAWPYANGPLHLGHIAGAYLPADIFARYHRLKGNEVLMVSGSDQHGTPITLRAEQEALSPREVAFRYHEQFVDCWQKLGISFDLFTSTGTANHAHVAREIFLDLLGKGYLYRDNMPQAYCPCCQRFLPDRYLEGICPHCGSPGARGDVCDDCGKPMSNVDIQGFHCRFCSSTPRFEISEHFFLRLSAFEDKIRSWMAERPFWRRNVSGTTRKFLDEGLKDRAVTRDMDWGVPVPQAGFEHKRMYVWFEAVIGYLSASKEWAISRGEEEAWRPFWQEKTRSFYFVGKDNIFFHTVVWPVMLMGCGNLNLPYDIPANEFLTIEGKKLSTSRNWAVWLSDCLERYDPDPLRYVLAANMPETGDADFSWREFLRRNNDELVATYGNLAHRALTFAYRHFDGKVPAPGELDDESKRLLCKAEETLRVVDDALCRRSFREALRGSMALAQEANRYLEEQSPWKKAKEDAGSQARSIYTVLSVLTVLRTTLYPFLPFSSEKLHSMLGFEGKVADVGWRWQNLPPRQKLTEPQPLFKKLDSEIVDQETSRLPGSQQVEKKP